MNFIITSMNVFFEIMVLFASVYVNLVFLAIDEVILWFVKHKSFSLRNNGKCHFSLEKNSSVLWTFACYPATMQRTYRGHHITEWVEDIWNSVNRYMKILIRFVGTVKGYNLKIFCNIQVDSQIYMYRVNHPEFLLIICKEVDWTENFIQT